LVHGVCDYSYQNLYFYERRQHWEMKFDKTIWNSLHICSKKSYNTFFSIQQLQGYSSLAWHDQYKYKAYKNVLRILMERLISLERTVYFEFFLSFFRDGIKNTPLLLWERKNSKNT
jgi:hypothetical protein